MPLVTSGPHLDLGKTIVAVLVASAFVIGFSWLLVSLF